MQDLSFLHTVNNLDALFKDLIEALNSEAMKKGIASLKNLDLSEELETLTKEDAQHLLNFYAMYQDNSSILMMLPSLKDVLPEGYLENLNHLKDEIEPYLEVLPKIVNDSISKEELADFIAETEKERIESRKIIHAKASDFPYMTIEEIKEKYSSHWVGLAQPQYEGVNIIGGNVIAANTDYVKANKEIGMVMGGLVSEDVLTSASIYTGVVDDTPMI